MRTLCLVISLCLAISFATVDGHPWWAASLSGAFAAVFVLISESKK